MLKSNVLVPLVQILSEFCLDWVGRDEGVGGEVGLLVGGFVGGLLGRVWGAGVVEAT